LRLRGAGEIAETFYIVQKNIEKSEKMIPPTKWKALDEFRNKVK
jgi:hypothetical protein